MTEASASAAAQGVVEVKPEQVPVFCPNPAMPLWSSHPRVFLHFDGEFPTLGAWCHYGLGSLNENLPQFISMGNREYWNKRDGFYLGPRFFFRRSARFGGRSGGPLALPAHAGAAVSAPFRMSASASFRADAHRSNRYRTAEPASSSPSPRGARTSASAADARAIMCDS